MKTEPIYTRRAFLKTMSAGAALAALPGCQPSSEQAAPLPDQTPPLPQIGLQLWTLREAIEQDMAGTLQKIADLGFSGVETAFFPEDVTVAQAGRALADAGLSVFGVHCEIPVGEQREAMLAMAEAYACDRMVWHGWPEDPRSGSVDGIKELAEIYNEANAFAQSNGLRFGLHNHWWEFREVDGIYPFYLLMDLVEPDVFFEIDTYWTKVAGLDPATVVGDFGERAPLLHIKDGPATSTDGPMTAVGQGVQDFPAIAEAAAGATEWMIVEIDSAETDMFDAVAQSYAYLTQNGLARGRV